MKIEDFNGYFNNSSNKYEFSKEELESLLGNSVKTGITENGVKILKCMQENCEKYNNIFTSKSLGELLFMSPRSVSGSMKKLITDGYTGKLGVNPVSYALTDLGKDFQFDKE